MEHSGGCVEPVEWMGLSLRVPADWEIVRHSLVPRKGGLTFVDRRHQRLQATWTQCVKPPLMDRMLDDHRARQLKDEPEASFERFRHPTGFEGLHRLYDDGRVITRLARFDQATDRLLELVVLHKPERDDAGLLDALAAAARITARPEAARRWRAFGLDITAPDGFIAVGCQANPADVTVQFAKAGTKKHAGRPGPTATVRRLGMADGWFAGDLEKTLKALEPKARFTFDKGGAIHEQPTGADPSVTATAVEAGPRLKRMAGLLRHRRDLLYHNQSANTLVHVSTFSRDTEPLRPGDLTVAVTTARHAGGAR